MKLTALRLLTAICCGMAPAIAMADDTPSWVAQANNAFAVDLYGKLAAADHGNLFFSPNSIAAALTMTYAGARGDTAKQMAAVLHLPPESATIDKDFGAFIGELNGSGADTGQTRGYDLSVANALWGEKSLDFLSGFVDLLKSNYGAALREVDFAGDPEGARLTINTWVDKQTHDKITGLIGPGVLTRETLLVLTNAIYFKGTWAAQFDKAATSDEPFHSASGEGKNTPMMHRTGKCGYMAGDDYQALKLGYAGGGLSMIILLPRDVDGVQRLEKELTPAMLSGLAGEFREQKVIVTMPKFRMTEKFELGPTLASMGMPEAFGGAADFSGMTGRRDVRISGVIHKAYVEVNEEGTEAAAATGVVMTLAMAGPISTPVFRADHPFIYLIEEEKTGAILFMGRLVEPG